MKAPLIAAILLLASQFAFAGGPLYVGGPTATPGRPYKWNNQSPVTYYTDRSGLGALSKAQADQFTADCFDVWHIVTTANISFSRAGDLSVDVNASNALSLLNNHSSELYTKTAIVYDIDGTLTDALYGQGASNSILGFANITNGASDGTNNYFQTGLAVLNGKWIDGISGTEISQNKFKEAFVHEFGHLIGLDHSQVNWEVLYGYTDADRLAGLPTMFPFMLNTAPRPSLAPDDIATVSRLYPTATFAGMTGTITGHVYFSDGITPVQGLNVLARLVDNPATSQDESLRTAYSSVSGFLFTADAGNTVTAYPGSEFGSRNQALIGYYELSGLTPGEYIVQVEAIYPDFIGGSSVGPIGKLGFQFPMSGNCTVERWNIGDSQNDSCNEQTILVIAPGTQFGPDMDIILNGTPPRYDAWEGSELRMPSRPSLGEVEEVLA